MARLNVSMTVEETQAILAEHYPWALKGNEMTKPKCVECEYQEVEIEGDICDICLYGCEEDEEFEDEE